MAKHYLTLVMGWLCCVAFVLSPSDVSAETFGTIKGRVWNDLNNNHLQDPSEMGMSTVWVQVETSAGGWVNGGYTDMSGEYNFANIPGGGSYRVKIANPANGFNGVTPNEGNDDSIDSDVDIFGFSSVFTLAVGQTVDIDGGFTTGGQCYTPVTATISNVQCVGGNQFTFQITATGGTAFGGQSWGWNYPAGGLMKQPYGQPVTVGPFSGCNGTVTATISDVDNPFCTATISAEAPANCCGGPNLTFNCQNNIIATATPGANGTVVAFNAPTAATTCPGGATTVTQISGPASGSVFPLGTTEVCFKATDNCGNEKTCCFNVTVNPGTSTLTFNCQNNITVTAAPGANGTVVTFNAPTATTTCPGGATTVTQISGPASGSVFPLGTTQVCFKATDNCGNEKTCCFNVTVNPGGGTPDCETITFTPTATNSNTGQITIGNLTAPIVLIQVFNSGWGQVFSCVGNCNTPTQVVSGLSVGTYYVKVDYLTANWSPICTKQLYVTIPPGNSCDNVTNGGTIGSDATVCPGNVFVSLSSLSLPTGGTGTIEYQWISSTTACPTSIGQAIAGATSATYDVGTLTQTTWYARLARRAGCTDWAGASNCVKITVSNLGCGNTNLICPNNISVTAAVNQTTAVVTYPDPQISTTCVGPVNVTRISGPASGSAFPVGTTQVCFKATDDCGNEKTCCFNVTVNPVCVATRTVDNSVEKNDGTNCSSGQTYGIWLNAKWPGSSNESSKYFKISGGSFVENADGTATLTGLATNNSLANVKFNINVTFCGRTFTAPSGSPKTADCYTINNSGWYYYTSVCGTLTGQGDAAGAVLNIVRTGPAFQVGTGANLNESSQFGASGWFNVQILSHPTGKTLTFTSGDINIRLGGSATLAICGNGSANCPACPPPPVCDDVHNGGTIGSHQTICPGSTPATLSNVTSPTGGTGTIEYQWLSSTSSCPDNPSQAIPGATNATYSPGPLTQTTWFVRCARRAGCSDYSNGESNCVKITVSNNGCGSITFNCQNNITVTATGPNGAVVTYTTPTATTTCPTGGASVTRTSGLASGSTFPVGTTSVCFKATDNCGNEKTCCFTVTVTAPPVSCTDCPVTKPLGNTCQNNPAAAYWNTNGWKRFQIEGAANFRRCADGTATITARLVREGSSDKFDLVLNLGGRTTTPPSGSPHAHGCKNINTAGWEYYTTTTGTLTGVAGSVIGKIVTLSRGSYPALQVGYGANTENLNFGASAWLWADVASNFGDYRDAQLDVEFDLGCPPTPAFPDPTKCYRIVNKSSNRAMEADKIPQLVQYAIDHTSSQRWKFQDAGNGYFYIVTQKSGETNKVVEIPNASQSDGAYAAIATKDNGTDQQFKLESAGTGFYYIVARHSGKALKLESNPGSNNTRIIQKYVSSSFEHQKWKIEAIDCASGALAQAEALTFNAFRKGQTADLQWVSRTGQVAANYFVVERSADGHDFTPIKMVNAAGNIFETEYHSTNDAQPLKGDNFYRVREALTDGTERYSSIEKVTMPDTRSLDIYPNPANANKVWMDVSQFAGQAIRITMYNQLGSIAKTFDIAEAPENAVELSIEGLGSGFYGVEVTAANGVRRTVKLVVSRVE